MITERVLEVIFTSLLVIVSIWLIIEGYLLSLGNLYDIGPGFLIFFEAILMAILGISNLQRLLKKHRKSIPAFFSIQGLKKVIWTIVISIVTLLLFETLGFVIMSTFFMVLLLRLVGREKWVRLTIVAILTTLLSYSIFKLLLNISLPVGPFGL